MSKKYTGIIILAIIIFSFLFYWYEFRPYQTKRDCFQETTKNIEENFKDERKTTKEWGEVYDFYYKNCLRKRGL